MNRFDTALAADIPSEAGITHLSVEILDGWSGDDFALAVEIARAPATFASGIGDMLVHLVIAEAPGQDAVAVLPLSVEGNTLLLGIDHDAMDALIGLLDGAMSAGAGGNMSLDAIEALCVAMVSPLMRMQVGDARWDGMNHGVAALKIGPVELPLQGEPSAILALQGVMSDAGATQAQPLKRLSQPLAQRMSVDMEQVHGLVHLSAEDLAALEPGCGIMLDTLWPDGRPVAGGRFVRSGAHWQADADLQAGCLRVRSTARVNMLGELSLGTGLPQPSGQELELLDGVRLIARGHLTSLELSGMVRTLFQIDQLA